MSLTEPQTTATNPVSADSPAKKRRLTLPGPLARLDRGILALLIVFVLTLPLFTPRIYASDEIKYYSYLHSIFFDHDVNFTNEYTYFYELNPQKNLNIKEGMLDKLNEKGIPVNEGPVGSALLWTPFYGLAHVVALAGHAVGIKGFQPDGYSTPYIWAISLGSLLYGWFGLLFAYLFCRNFLPGFWAAFATITVWLATPVIFYLSLTPPMSHANSLFMISLWLWLWYKTRGWRIDEAGNFIPGLRRGSMWLLLGVLGGLATMVREQDGTILIIAAVESLYLYWQGIRGQGVGIGGRGSGIGGRGSGVGEQAESSNLQSPISNLQSPQANLQSTIYNPPRPIYNLQSTIYNLFARNLIFLAGFVISLVPQFVVYLALNGKPGPSKVVGDKLQFFNPEVILRLGGLLADPDHGLWWWSPVLLPALIGLILMARERRLRFLAVVLIVAFVAELYVSASFQTWTMKGSFGPRRLVGISPAYIAGLGYLAWWLANLKRGWHLSRRWLIALATLFVAWNFGLIFQFSAIRTPDDRQNLDPARVVRDQFTVVPGRLVDTAQKFIFHRDKFYKQ